MMEEFYRQFICEKKIKLSFIEMLCYKSFIYCQISFIISASVVYYFLKASCHCFRRASPMWEEFVTNAESRKVVSSLDGDNSEASITQKLRLLLRPWYQQIHQIYSQPIYAFILLFPGSQIIIYMKSHETNCDQLSMHQPSTWSHSYTLADQSRESISSI